MAESKRFLSQTAETASFALREYFRPLVAFASLFKPNVAPPESQAPAPHQDPISLEEAKSILRERLAEGRQHEKLLVTLAVISGLASLLALSISLMLAIGMGPVVVLAILVPSSVFALWVILRLVQNREKIIELKTIRWVMKAVDEETAERVMKQVLWGKPKKKRRSKKDKNAR